MKSTHITFFNVVITIICHILVFFFLRDWAMKAGACGMGVAMIAGWFLLFLNSAWSSIILIYILLEYYKKSNHKITWLFSVLGIIGNLITAVFLEYHLWALLIIPYLLFLGESFYLKYENKFENQSNV